MILDTDFIIRRRQSLGMSQRTLARRLGVSSTLISRLEDGVNHDDLPLSTLPQLATALACSSADLLAPATDKGPTVDVGLVQQVGAVLAEVAEPVPIDLLADTLNTSLDRIPATLGALSELLTDVGMVVFEDDGVVSIAPTGRAVPLDRLAQMLRLHLARRGMNTAEADMLAAARDGRLTSQALQGRAPVLTAGRLRNAGYLTRDEPPQYAAAPVTSSGDTG